MPGDEAPAVLRLARRFDAPPERVFDAWLDPPAADFRDEAGEMQRVELGMTRNPRGFD